MNRFGILALSMLLLGGLCYTQSSTPGQVSSGAAGHGAFPVKVSKTLDSSKLKEGDAVQLETAGSFKLPDGTLVTKGSKIDGRVTTSKARSKGDPDSQLAITFDKLSIANGKQLSIKGTIQAVFPPFEEAAPNMAGKATAGAGGGSEGAVVGTVTDAKNGSNMESSGNAQAVLDPKAVGVQGIHGLELKDGVLSSNGKNVKLGGGVRMVVYVEILSYNPTT